MFRIYRWPKHGEFFLLGGDTAQGGEDSNMGGALSYEHIDFPIVWDFPFTVAATVTPYLYLLAEWLYRVTGVKPMIGLERNNGGSSEMERLRVLNSLGHYRLYQSKTFGRVDGQEETTKLGWDTTGTSRPKLIGDWRDVFDAQVPVIYDRKTLSQHKTFITNKRGRPEAAKRKHDDGVIYSAICWQMYKTERPEVRVEEDTRPFEQTNFMVN